MKSKASPKSKKVSFRIESEPGCEVYVAGSFNNWDASQYRMRDNPDEGVYKTTLTLSPGRHEYKFIVNGEWRLDPSCPDWLPNDMGTLNSVVSV